MKSLTLLLLLLLSFPGVYAQEDFFSNKLVNLDNNTIRFSDFKKNKATVLVFLLSDCPASQDYTRTLEQLSLQFSEKGVQFIGIFPGNFAADEELREFRRQYKITFPLLKDPDMNFARKLGAGTVPSCFLFDSKGALIYKGRIDDWLYSLGKKRQVITKHELRDAISGLLQNLPVKVKETKPIGCILEFEN
jgi:peroxiredoxin